MKIFRKQGDSPWQEVTEGLPEGKGTIVTHLLTSPDIPSVFYGVNNHGVYQSIDRGKTWEKLAVEFPDEVKKSRINAACLISELE